ncbi:MAG: MucR family transcriptional regulator [Alphaproteobacteria bacterium]|nr:MucR family transcriptional regulator [Alphaproteobacteria bacterium]
MTDENNSLDHATNHLDIMCMVSNIVAAYVSTHTVESSELPSLIQQIQRNLRGRNSQNAHLLSSPGVPAVPIEESIKPDYIVCLEDGKQMKMLKRHLKTSYGMTPDQYRERWDLPANYPMVAPNYAKRRQEIANSIGLGTRRKKKAA